jgi:hypothetical protein
MQTVDIQAAKTHLSRLVDAAAAGEEILIARAAKPSPGWCRCWTPKPDRAAASACWPANSACLPTLTPRFPTTYSARSKGADAHILLPQYSDLVTLVS